MNPLSWKVKAVGAALAVAIIAGGGAGIAWWATSTSYKADIADLKQQHSNDREAWGREKTAITIKAQQDTASALQRTRAAQEAAATADNTSQEKLANAKRENDALRAAVAAGDKRVRILSANLATANLAASQHATSGDPGSSSVGDAVQIEFSAAGQQTVLDLRESTQRDDEVIQYLQNYINDVAKQCKP